MKESNGWSDGRFWWKTRAVWREYFIYMIFFFHQHEKNMSLFFTEFLYKNFVNGHFLFCYLLFAYFKKCVMFFHHIAA